VALSGRTERFGTGIVLTSSGEILTNSHVVNNAMQVMATDVGNGQTYGALSSVPTSQRTWRCCNSTVPAGLKRPR
jgi:hypothetical protein